MTTPISPLPTPPSPADSPVGFNTKAFALLGALPAFVTEANAQASGLDASVAAAGAQATIATNKAGEALTSANNAALSKTGADGARDAAVIAKNAAEAALDSFDDRYLGAKAVAPTTDNDGGALLTGAMYWDTALPGMRSWNGAAWVTLPAATAAAISNTPAGSLAATTVQAAINELDSKKSRSLFAKADTDSVAFTKTGAGTISLKAGTYVDVSGTLLTFAAATAVTMPALSAGTDYAVYACTDGTLRADASFTAPTGYTAANSRLIGGFHYGLIAPGTTVAGGSFATAGTGMIWTQADVDAIAGINAFSLWDLKWRCKGEQKGMALDPYAGVWAAIYFCPSDHIANGISKYNTDVASGTVLPRIPVAYGGNGSANYTALTWWAANEIANSHGHRLPTEREFSSAAFGVTENQSLGGAASTIPATARQPGYTSRIGLEQVTGHVQTFGTDSSTRWDGASTPWNWRDVNGGRGQVYLYGDANLVRVLLGGNRGHAAMSGSRTSGWIDSPWLSGWSVGLRAFGDHLKIV